MITKENTYTKAFEIKKQNLLEKQKRQEMLLASAYVSEKRLSQIDNELASLGASLALTALSGDSKAIENIKVKSQALSIEKEIILKKCNIPEIEYDCPLCNDSGYVGGKVCDCVKKLSNAIAINELSAKMPLSECGFDNFDLKFYPDKDDNRNMTSILKLCKEYALNFDPDTSGNLLFLGGPGLGKTHLSLAIVSEVIKKGYFPVYGPAENLFTAVEKEKFQNNNSGAYEQMQECDLLVIDDLGTELVTSFTRSVLYNLINSRLLTKKPTLINTNLSIDEIIEKYSPRIASRLFGEFTMKEFVGTDIRQQKNIRR